MLNIKDISVKVNIAVNGPYCTMSDKADNEGFSSKHSSCSFNGNIIAIPTSNEKLRWRWNVNFCNLFLKKLEIKNGFPERCVLCLRHGN